MKGAIGVFFLTSVSALCQGLEPGVLNEPGRVRYLDGRDLYPRLAASDYVITGTVTKVEGIRPRLSEEERQKGERKLRLSNVLTLDNSWGSLYTIAVDAPLCRQVDVVPAASPALGLSKEVYIFSERRELIFQGWKYLLFLEKNPEQERITTAYELNPIRTYYRALGGSRSAVKLPNDAERGQPADFATPLLSAVTALCQAVQPANVFSKLQGLEMLRFSVDFEVRENAEAGIKALTEANTGNQQ